MTLKTGLNNSLGIAEESTYGVPVAPTRHLPIRPETTIEANPEWIWSEAILAGRRLPVSGQGSPGKVNASAEVALDMNDRSMGLLFKHMFGAVSTSGAGPYTHTFTPGDIDGKSLTLQFGETDGAGTVNPFTFSGSKIEEWEIAAKVGEYLSLGLTIAAKDAIIYRTVTDGVTTNTSTTITSATAAFSQDDIGKPISGTGIPAGATIASVASTTSATLSAAATATGTGITFTFGLALTAVSYASSIAPMSSMSCAVTVAGSAYQTKEFSLKGNNALNTDRYFIGSQARGEAREAAQREYTGTINSEFFDMTAYRRFVAGTESALVFSAYKGTSTLTITMNVQYTGSTPKTNGTDVMDQELPFRVIGTTTDALGITAVLVNGDATP